MTNWNVPCGLLSLIHSFWNEFIFYRNIHADALEEDVKYINNESYFLIELDKLSEMIESQRNHKDKLENERFNIFTK